MFRRDFFRTLLGGALALFGVKARLDPLGLPLTYRGFPIVIEDRLPPPG